MNSACMKHKWSFFSVLHMYILLKSGLNLISFKTNSPVETGFFSFPQRISWENLFQIKAIFPLVITSWILTTFHHDYVCILLGENCLHTVFHTSSMVLMRRICLMIKTFSTWLSYYRHWCERVGIALHTISKTLYTDEFTPKYAEYNKDISSLDLVYWSKGKNNNIYCSQTLVFYLSYNVVAWYRLTRVIGNYIPHELGMPVLITFLLVTF